MNKLYQYWLDQIGKEERLHRDFRNEAKEVEKIYYDYGQAKQKFNILYSNVQVLHSAVLSNTPKPDVRRRFLSEEKTERDISEVLERAISYSVDQYNFKGVLDCAVRDNLVPALGQARVHYKPYFRTTYSEIDLKPVETENENGEITIRYFNENQEIAREKVHIREDDTFFLVQEEEEKIYEEVSCSHVPWSHFRWEHTCNWRLCNWACIDHIMDRTRLVDQFGMKGHEIPLLFTEDGQRMKTGEEEKGTHAVVHEIFDKRARKYRFLAPGMDDFIKVVDDPLGLEDFYPFPEPLFANTRSDELIPTQDFQFYREQARELEDITVRLKQLTNQLRYRGFYDGSFGQMASFASADDGQLIPVDDYQAKMPGGKLQELFVIADITQATQAVGILQQRRDEVKQTIYEINGISDIIRGASKASETLGAQQIKTQFAGIRIAQRQQDVERFVRDIFRIKAEIIAEHFDPKTLTLMTGVQVTPEMQRIMKDDLLRSYKIDVESDSTVFQDAQQEQKNRVEVISALTKLVGELFPAIQSGLVPIEIAKELVLFGIRSFKTGRQLEDAIEQLGNRNGSNLPAAPSTAQVGGAALGNELPPGAGQDDISSAIRSLAAGSSGMGLA